MNTGLKTLESMRLAQWYNKYTLGLFSRYLSGEILEIGTGIGNFSMMLAKFGKVTTIDIDLNYIEDNKKKFPKEISVGWGDIEEGRYFFKKKRFDSIVCLNVLEHIKDDDRAVENIYNLLKENGYLILQLPAHKIMYGSIDKSIGHYRRYDEVQLRKKLIDKGFKINFCRRFNFIGGIGWFIAGKILKKDRVEEGKIKLFNFLAPLILPLEKYIEPPIGTSVIIIAQK